MILTEKDKKICEKYGAYDENRKSLLRNNESA